MARGNAHILHTGKARELNALERLVYRYVRRRRDLIAEASSEAVRISALSLAAVARIRGSQPGTQSLVVTADGGSIPALAAAIEKRISGSAGITLLALQPDADARREESRIATRPDIMITTPARLIDHIRRDSVDLSGLATVAIDVPAGDNIEQFSADLHFIYTKLARRPSTVALTGDLGREFDLLEDLLRRPTTVPDSGWAAPNTRLTTSTPQEQAMKQLPIDPEQLKTRIDEITHAIHHDEDPVELTQLRKLVRRHTTVFNRGYVLAYLLKQSLEGGGRPRRQARSNQGSQEQRAGQTSQSDSDKQSVFVSIGRSKRVRSRDLITFFTSANGIGQDDIGQVKVLDNYSFVEVAADKAQAAVDELNGQELRGRKLTVNFARRK